jgi:pyruvate/2-oxoglutarate/acetoin dehydrogenase E1 component
MTAQSITYGAAIRAGFEYLLDNYPEVIVMGQGLWSPWYVGSSMTDLEKRFGKERVIDTPVSELACTGAALGAALAGMKAVVVHPRMDFLLYGVDAVVNQAAKWRHMFGGQGHAGVTIRAIVNRGGEQGAQHSQALHAWFAHVPGLRVVMPGTVADARDLLIAAVLCPDPVVYIDDRWLYDLTDDLPPAAERDLGYEGPRVIAEGSDVTIVGAGYTTQVALGARERLARDGVSGEVVDLRVLNPFQSTALVGSVSKTRRLLAVDGGWKTAGISSEVIASVIEAVQPGTLLSPPRRVTLPDAPAPASRALERLYYPTVDRVVEAALDMVSQPQTARGS